MNIKISIEEQKIEFEKFLSEKGDKRIFFSNTFGTGKTYFLKNFFENNTKYECFHLFPVNYQIIGNNDIINLIKYDILIELINRKKGENLFSDKKEKILFFKFLTAEGANDSLQEIVSYLGVLGKPLSSLLKIDKLYQEYKKNGKVTEQEEVDSFLQDIEGKKVEEVDYLSGLIADKINLIKGKDKKSVLILDDLDRIDPDHIFRILNIFSAHFDLEDNNKFGFDKVIIAGDKDNIEKIFYHKYGKDTNFDGYFDKFFTTAPYPFKNEFNVQQEIRPLMHRFLNAGSFQNSTPFEFLIDILEKAYILKKYTLRSLKSVVASDLNEEDVLSFQNGQMNNLKTMINYLMLFFKNDVKKVTSILEAIEKHGFQSLSFEGLNIDLFIKDMAEVLYGQRVEAKIRKGLPYGIYPRNPNPIVVINKDGSLTGGKEDKIKAVYFLLREYINKTYSDIEL